MSWLGDILSRGLSGHDAHVAPSRAVQGLSHEQATEKAGNDVHSVWEQLFHIVFWQDLCLRAIGGRRVDWEGAEGKDWPDQGDPEGEPWNDLRTRFLSGLEEAQRILKTMDLQTALESWGNAPAAKAFLVLVQHNSYHLGQIVSQRRTLGQWPPGP